MSDKIKFSERVREDLILLNVEGETREDIFKQVAELFVEKGIAKDTYYQGLLDREAEFPTGLPIGDYNIAIPHTYPEHYNDIGICIPSPSVSAPSRRSPSTDRSHCTAYGENKLPSTVTTSRCSLHTLSGKLCAYKRACVTTTTRTASPVLSTMSLQVWLRS